MRPQSRPTLRLKRRGAVGGAQSKCREKQPEQDGQASQVRTPTGIYGIREWIGEVRNLFRSYYQRALRRNRGDPEPATAG